MDHLTQTWFLQLLRGVTLCPENVRIVVTYSYGQELGLRIDASREDHHLFTPEARSTLESFVRVRTGKETRISFPHDDAPR